MEVLAVTLWLLLLAQTAKGAKNTPRAFELRFQNEIDNSTTIKTELQQQIFKCQVRLAPVSGLSAVAAGASRLKSSATPLAEVDEAVLGAAGGAEDAVERWPRNVSLTIHWFHDQRQLADSTNSTTGSPGEAVSVINVELKSNQGAKTGADKRNKWRVEIKNTLNGNQLKLTSRLKLNPLKITDSGHYKCIARATFRAYLPWPEMRPVDLTGKRQLVQVEQTLESSGANLQVVAAGSLAADTRGLNGQSEAPEGRAAGSRGPPTQRTPPSAATEPQQRQPQQSAPPDDSHHAKQVKGSNRPADSTGSGQHPNGQPRLAAETSGADRSVPLESEVGLPSLGGQFEDDEDLFKVEPDRLSEFISEGRSGLNQQPNGEADDQARASAEAPLDRPASEWSHRPSSLEDSIAGGDESSSATNETPPTRTTTRRKLQDKNLATNYSASGRINGGLQTTHHYQQQQATSGRNGDNNNALVFDSYLGGSLESTRLRLVKLVHKIAPELSCYTGNGDHYRGNVSLSVDGRVCLNWLQVKLASRQQYSYNSDYMALRENHNFCRNPNSDSRGPWCFVLQYNERLEGEQGLPKTHTAIHNGSNFEYTPRQCSIAPCSDYLWFYIVAPPLGLLMFISCLLTLLVRSIKSSHYNSMSSSSSSGSCSASKRRSMSSKIGKLLSTRRFPVVKRFAGAGKQSRYLDDDIFEIVDDIDWSDGSNHTHTLSPKSQESFKLNSSYSSSSANNQEVAPESVRLSSSKSINPLFNADKPSSIQNRGNINNNKDLPINVSRSVTQVGPMFATLRCQMRSSGGQKSGNLNQRAIIDQCDLATNRQYTNNKPSYAGESVQTKSVSSFKNKSPDRQPPVSQSMLSSGGNSSHLISCSSTTDDIESLNEASGPVETDKFVKASHLPQLIASSVSVAFNQQPIYEGKFSQVLVAYMKQQQQQQGDERVSHTEDSQSIGHIGTQVAICSLKANAAIDPSVFQSSSLKLRHLNHLNIVKLLGWFGQEIDEDEIRLKQQQQDAKQLCALVYDMAQLVDLSDWLKQQNKDNLTSSEPGGDLEIRKNLTCFVKQIALAIDYLHDQNIVYKDLACRNCFLDPTKMLIKLASFNIEFVFGVNDEQKVHNLKSMVRPKYLLDYYVIDSRPSECQLLPLSWIPLESILFNKFNKQTDVWSFGCLIYELFSLGEVAYFGYSSKQVIDTVRSNLMPPQPLLCPSGIYKLMCKCLSDIPTIRPSIKQIYEQLNLYSGQCSSFLDHHLCSLATGDLYTADNQAKSNDTKAVPSSSSIAMSTITKTKSYANIRNYSSSSSSNRAQEPSSGLDQVGPALGDQHKGAILKLDGPRLPLSQSINLGGNRLTSLGCAQKYVQQQPALNHYDEPVLKARKM